ncbi:hypothetical protein ML5_1172 [Micromonospora sp. L5]|nr:hypothetical protein ML5_1172 [Micromonospora sp. L5]SCL36827.1 hypothetical protein GA0070615_3161 [Micromonospora aurantiaca]
MDELHTRLLRVGFRAAPIMRLTVPPVRFVAANLMITLARRWGGRVGPRVSS